MGAVSRHVVYKGKEEEEKEEEEKGGGAFKKQWRLKSFISRCLIGP